MRPGEISLAHNGVLFLDELLEFPRSVLEMLRQPLEDRAVTIVRVRRGVTFPADFMLIAALNPCPCGHLGSAVRTCTCSAAAIAAYRSRLSGPLLDRIDLHVDVPALPYRELAHAEPGRDRARPSARASWRRASASSARGHALERPPARRPSCGGVAPLDGAGHALLERAAARLGLSARAITRVRRVARTIADLDGSAAITAAHLAETLQYRVLDQPITEPDQRRRPMSSMKEKLKAVAGAIAAIEKQFGKGAIMPLSGGDIAEIGTIPTGSVGLDLALGVGGLPRGRVIEIYGPESSGKTTLTLHAIAEAQRAGGVCAFIDAEHALDVGYARKLGVRIEDLLVSQPDYGEQALEIADKLVRTGAIDLIVVDSVAALVPKAEIEGEMGDAHMGLQARLMSQALRKLTAATARNNTAVVVHQPASPEDRRGLRQPGDDDRRQRAEVLRVGAPRHPQDRRGQERRADGRHRDAREGGEEQGGAAVPRGGVRHPLRHGRQRPGRDRRPRRRRRACSRSRGRSTRARASGSRRAATTRAPTSPSTRRSPRRCASRCSRRARRRTPRWGRR